MPAKRNTLEKAMERVIPVPECGCWIFDGAPVGKGYMSLTHLCRSWRAHRWFYEQLVGPIPEGMVVCHRCDVPSCVNPYHLFVATQAENIADKTRKGRQAKGSKMGQAKLTEADIPLIRVATGTQAQIAQRFGVDRALIRRIKAGKAWAHVRQ